jgi:drug/metabolite transporter (DMT)-like permease
VFCASSYFVFPTSHDPAQVADPLVLLKLLGMAATATVGQIFLTLAFATGAPSKVSVVGLTQIVMGLALDVWLWDHPVNAAALVGTALVIAPTAWLLTRPAAVDVHDPEPGEPPPVVVSESQRGAASTNADASRPAPSLRL